MNDKKNLQNSDFDKETYRRIRRSIGWLGMLLPIILFILSQFPFFNTKMQGSISEFYYTNLREIFTGILCAVGLFLIRYKGTSNNNFLKDDGRLTNFAGLMAFGIALFPTNPANWSDKINTLFPINNPVMGWLHYGFALFFFTTIAWISIKIFTIGQVKNKDLPISIFNENIIYKICGFLILFFIILIPIFSYFKLFSWSTFLFEALSLITFGISWLIKGRALGDKGKIGERIYMESN